MTETFKQLDDNRLEITTPETVEEKVEVVSKDTLLKRRAMLIERLARVDELLAQFKAEK